MILNKSWGARGPGPQGPLGSVTDTPPPESSTYRVHTVRIIGILDEVVRVHRLPERLGQVRQDKWFVQSLTPAHCVGVAALAFVPNLGKEQISPWIL